jgi:hypothetical protein
MDISTRRVLIVTAILTITGCSSTTGQTSLAPPGTGLSPLSRLTTLAGMPPGLFPVMRHDASRHAVHAAGYPTNKSLLFESDFSTGAVNVYQVSALSGNPGPIASITEPAGGCPYDMTMSRNKTLFLVDSCLMQVEEYPKGSTTLGTTITDGLTYPLGIAIDKQQTLYVSEGSSIQEYAKGSTSPTKTITGGGLSEPFGLSLDSTGNLYIADFGASAVFELPAGGSSVTNLGLTDLTEPLGTAVDKKAGLLWVTDGSGDKVNVYQLGTTSPLESIAGGGFPYAVSIENRGTPNDKDTAVYADESTETVYAFMAGSYTPYADLTNGIGNPAGVLITRP